MQVFFESEVVLDLPIFLDTVTQIGEIINNPLGLTMLKRGLWPGHRRCKRNFNAMRSTWQRTLTPTPRIAASRTK